MYIDLTKKEEYTNGPGSARKIPGWWHWYKKDIGGKGSNFFETHQISPIHDIAWDLGLGKIELIDGWWWHVLEFTRDGII